MTVQAPERPPVVAPALPAEVVVRGAPVLRTCVAAFLASSAAGWMAAGLFQGSFARAIGVLAPGIGAGLIALSYRTRRPSLVQYLVLPLAGLLGALLVLPDARGGADLTSLVSEALRGGGLAQPPLAFDPGWRFVLVMLGALVGAAGAGLGIALARPKLAVALPVPVILGAALLAPPGGATTSGAVAIALLLAGLAVSYGAELEGEAAGAGFERKRLVRGAAALVLLMAAMVGLSQARFLFPSTTAEHVVPAQRPATGAVLPDRVLFQVRSKDPGPWRLGVLDGYDGRAWLLPSFDPARLQDIGADGSLVRPPATIRTDRPTIETTFTMAAIEGHVLPVAPAPVAVRGLGARVQLDPLTGSLRTPETRLRAGFRYTIVGATPPNGRELSNAPPAPAWTEPYAQAPVAPNEVVTLLAKAPGNAWDRLQFVRAALYRKVIAAGAGHPAEVPPERVAAMLRGAEATPYEITAAEALIARWAGIPARIGYGFYAGDRAPGAQVATVRPRHGATWLEAYFEGYGWVPVVGVPPRARPSLSQDQKNANPNVRRSDELALIVHVPIRLHTEKLLYVTVRYWFGVGLLFLAIALALWWSLPGALKVVRRSRRARWARANGPGARIAVAYAEFRDAAADAGIGAHAASPLRFCGALAPDDEHLELAWLVSRALWGDLRRDIREQDATVAEEMARSVRQRMMRAQAPMVRVLAFGARASLREPYSTEVPGVAWFGDTPRRRRTRRRASRRARVATVASLLVVLASCGSGATPSSSKPHALPARLVPDRLGDLTFKREPKAEAAYTLTRAESLVTGGRVFTVRQGSTIQASIQAAAFKPGIDALDHDVRAGILDSIGGGRFRLHRFGDERVYTRDLPEQRLLLWFTPDGGAMILMDARRAFAGADTTFTGILGYIRGVRERPSGPQPLPYDPRRGSEP